MKKLFSVVFLIFGFTFVLSAEDIVESFSAMAEKLVDVEGIDLRPRYAFMTLSSDLDNIGIDEYVTDALMEAVYSTGKIRIVERSKLDNILKELNLQNSGLIDDATAKEIGKVAGVDYICYGNLSELEGLLFVKVSVTDVQTGELCALASDYIVPDEYIKELTLNRVTKEKEAKKLAKEKAKKEKRERNKKNDDSIGLYVTYDSIMPEAFKYYGITLGAEQKIGLLTIGPSLGICGPYEDIEDEESAYFYGYLNARAELSVFYLGIGLGYGFDTTPNKINSLLAHGQVGLSYKGIRVEYTAEEILAVLKLRQKASVGFAIRL